MDEEIAGGAIIGQVRMGPQNGQHIETRAIAHSISVDGLGIGTILSIEEVTGDSRKECKYTLKVQLE